MHKRVTRRINLPVNYIVPPFLFAFSDWEQLTKFRSSDIRGDFPKAHQIAEKSSATLSMDANSIASCQSHKVPPRLL